MKIKPFFPPIFIHKDERNDPDSMEVDVRVYKPEVPEPYHPWRDFFDTILWGLYGAAAFVALTVGFVWLYHVLVR